CRSFTRHQQSPVQSDPARGGSRSLNVAVSHALSDEQEQPMTTPESEPQGQYEGGEEAVRDVRQTTCCVVGGGPAGVFLALLLARQGVDVTLLEAHHDFDRDFRGDTIHPSTLEALDQLGLADRLLAIPHGKLRTM